MSRRDEFIQEALLLRAAECAALTGIAVTTWWRRDAAGLTPRAVRVGNTTRWRRAELLAWVQAGCPPRDVWEKRARPA